MAKKKEAQPTAIELTGRIPLPLDRERWLRFDFLAYARVHDRLGDEWMSGLYQRGDNGRVTGVFFESLPLFVSAMLVKADKLSEEQVAEMLTPANAYVVARSVSLAVTAALEGWFSPGKGQEAEEKSEADSTSGQPKPSHSAN